MDGRLLFFGFLVIAFCLGLTFGLSYNYHESCPECPKCLCNCTDDTGKYLAGYITGYAIGGIGN